MSRRHSAGLRLRVLAEMLRYDLLFKLRGFPGIRRKAGISAAGGPPERGPMMAAVCQALGEVSSFYWKPLLCLQRSVVLARVLRAEGIQAEIVIGYRANPFFSHAWVEVGGRVIDDSPAYQKLNVLDRF